MSLILIPIRCIKSRLFSVTQTTLQPSRNRWAEGLLSAIACRLRLVQYRGLKEAHPSLTQARESKGAAGNIIRREFSCLSLLGQGAYFPADLTEGFQVGIFHHRHDKAFKPKSYRHTDIDVFPYFEIVIEKRAVNIGMLLQRPGNQGSPRDTSAS